MNGGFLSTFRCLRLYNLNYTHWNLIVDVFCIDTKKTEASFRYQNHPSSLCISGYISIGGTVHQADSDSHPSFVVITLLDYFTSHGSCFILPPPHWPPTVNICGFDHSCGFSLKQYSVIKKGRSGWITKSIKGKWLCSYIRSLYCGWGLHTLSPDKGVGWCWGGVSVRRRVGFQRVMDGAIWRRRCKGSQDIFSMLSSFKIFSPFPGLNAFN